MTRFQIFWINDVAGSLFPFVKVSMISGSHLGKERQFCHWAWCKSPALSQGPAPRVRLGLSGRAEDLEFELSERLEIMLMEKGDTGSFHMISHSEGLGGFHGIISTELSSGHRAEEETVDQFIKLQSGKFLLVSKLSFWLSERLGKTYTDVLITCLVF